MGFDLSAFSPGKWRTPESPQNALMRGLEMQRAQQGNALQQFQIQALMQRAEQERAAQALTRRFVTPENRPGDGIGPTQEAGFDVDGYTNALMGVDPMKAIQLRQAMAKQERPPIIAGPGSTVLDPVTRKPIYTAPFKPEPDKTPEALRTLEAIYGKGTPEYQQAARLLAQKMTTHTPAPSIVNYGSPVPVELPDGKTGYVQPSNRGGPAAPMADVGGKPLVKPAEADTKALTEGQAKAMVYASRMLAADKTLAALARKGVFASVPGSRTPVVGDVINAVSPADQQQLDQAKRDFINAVLRRESGAVIADSEFKNADKQYFPQIGDSREVREQKARNRRIAIEGIRADVPKNKQSEVDRISTGGESSGVVEWGSLK